MSVSPPVGAQTALVLALLVSFGLAVWLVWRRGHVARLRRLGLPAVLLVVFCIPDALVTLRGTWGDPALEADPFVRAFLWWEGWKGLCLALALWVLGWALVVDGLESLRPRLPGWAAAPVWWGELYTLYAVALGHLDGFTSWTHSPGLVYHASDGLLAALARAAPWTISTFPLAYVLYPSLVYGALFTALHVAVATIARRGASAAPAGPAARMRR